MKNIQKMGKIALGAVIGSLLWAGCASNNAPQQRPLLEQTMDLQNTGPDTHPAWRTDNYDQIDYNLQPWDVESIQ